MLRNTGLQSTTPLLLWCLLATQGMGMGCKHVDRVRHGDLSAANDRSVSHTHREIQHTIRLKVVVDAAHRREQLRWRDRIDEMIEAASDELTAQFGVKIEVVAFEEWDHDGTNQPLEEVLRALAIAHPVLATREDRVLAITSSLPSPTIAHHDLGMAHEHGEHLVLRGMQDHAEQEHIEASLDVRTRHLGQTLYHERLAHKRATVFLHELAHTYGAMHTRDDGQIMSPSYDHKITSFCPINTILLEEAFRLDAELGAQPHATWRRAMLAEVEQLDAASEPLLAQIPRQEIERALTRAHEERLEQVSPEAALRDALRAFEREDFTTAWETLSPMLKDHPTAEAFGLACSIQHQLNQSEQGDLEPLIHWCTRTFDNATTQPERAAFAAQVIAIAHLKRDEPLLATSWARLAAEALHELGETSKERWLALALIQAATGALTHAEKLCGLAGMTRDASRLMEEILLERQRYSMFDLEPDDEPALYQLAKQLQAALNTNDTSSRDAILAKLEALAPSLAPTLVARCQVAIDQNVARHIARDCKEAVNKVPQGAMAHYGMAISSFVHKDDAAAISSLKRSIELAPSLELHWALLARHYRQRNKTQRLETLRRTYTDHFQRDPPW